MEKYSIATGTVTAAIRCRDLLRKNGFKAYIERNTGKDRIGCGYTVSVSGNLRKIKEIINKSGIKIYDIKSFS